ncbi:PE family protein [Mycobacterium ostraviense]|uniref:PE family protein n=1 Tax=Mycobacterium ostraviense TaxID=2738409 RepID=A0A163XVJ9_9MYCO|nr:PE family protein [Mycobacterium ostraviense]KZS59804.1 PE family protein [Mycobacterium ostraviense]UGT93539.1 PE family protein [Mycobacterium ostraviense]
MDTMSHDPSAGDIGSQLVDIGSQGISASSTAAMTVLTGLIPAGAEEVSAQAVMAFAQEAASMLASNVAAQEELMRTGSALTNIARMYGDADDSAADALAFRGAAISRSAAGGSGATLGPGLMGSGAVQAAAESVARAPLMSQMVEASSSPMASTAANAGSSAMSGAAPLSSGMGSGMGTGAPAGGASKAGLTSATGPADQDERERDEQTSAQSGERLA